jgi:ABC-type branched-subunit amino acid transport system ATPase component/ABC-type branched-subunit amino acid transport system permease subunit
VTAPPAVTAVPVVGFEVPLQVVFNGIVAGFAYGVLAIGLVLVYRSSHVVNFAYGQIGAFATALLALLVVNWDVHFLAALPAVLVVGAVIGGAVELVVVRRLFAAPRIVLFVATLGVAQLLLAAQLLLPGLERFGRYPTPWSTRFEVGSLTVRSEHLLVLLVVPAVAAALAFFLERTRIGKAIRAAAANPDAARLSAIDIRTMSTLVWVLAGLLATVTAVLVAPLRDTTGAIGTALGPALLLRALAAALVGRMQSLPLALLGGTVIGVAEALLFFNAPTDPGRIDAVLFVVVVVAVLVVARRGTLPEAAGAGAFVRSVRSLRPAGSTPWPAWLPAVVGIAGAIAVPFVITQPSRHLLYAQIALSAILGLSLTVLAGWAGQLSLGQFAFCGLGAMLTAALVRGMDITVGDAVLQVPIVPFELAVLIAAVVTTLVAVGVGVPALRVRGLLLSVTTLAFAVMAGSWLLTRPFLTGDDAIVYLPRARWGDAVSLDSQRTYYFVCLAVLVLVALVLQRLRRSGIGRSMLAVRDNEQAAAALTVSPVRLKLLAFAVSGALAGLAGGLLAGLLVQFEATDFTPEESLRVVSVAVIGGLGSISGAILGALWVFGLPALLGESPEVDLLTSGIGLLILLLYIPGGLTQVVGWITAAIPQRPVPPPHRKLGQEHALLARSGPNFAGAAEALRVEGVTVRFGGRVAVDDVALSVGSGEIVGLIGANGAGKSTLMNAIGGFVPARGTVEVFGADVSHLPSHRRAGRGLGRSFQGAELFADLTVRDTVLVALEARDRTTFVPTVLGLPKARRAERARRGDADDILDFLGLGRFAETTGAELSTGTRRIVELACLLALDARLLCLDEPTAGVAQRETEALAPLVLRLREELGASLLVIEHDMPFVMGISDRVVCLEAGRVIAAGTPTEVRNDARVIASYLGTLDRVETDGASDSRRERVERVGDPT